MNIEFEAKFFVPHEQMREKLKNCGAILQYSKVLMRRTVFNLPGSSCNNNQWLRVRDEGHCVTLTLKSNNGLHQIDSIKELETVVADYDIMIQILQQIGCSIVMCAQNYRETWRLQDCIITLDTWPWLDELVEIEGLSKDSVLQVVHSLGLDIAHAYYGPNSALYEKKYGISHDQMMSTSVITFDQKPDWVV